MKDVVENEDKIFTKKSKNNIIISKDYNPLKVIMYEREGILMDNNVILEEAKKLSKKYNKKEKMFLEMLKIGIKEGYSIEDTKTIIDEFESKNNCY